MNSNLVRDAFRFAAKAHDGQHRKYTGEPYIVHPVEVAALVEHAGLGDEVIAAALLHDVVEDCGVTANDLVPLFGGRVTKLVLEVTDVSMGSKENRKTRKAMDREHLAKASPEGKSIKLADLINNTETITLYDPDFARVYMREKQLLLPHLVEGNPVLFDRAKKLVLDFFS